MSLENHLPNLIGENNKKERERETEIGREIKEAAPKNKQEAKSLGLGKKIMPYLAALLTVSPGLKTIAQEKSQDKNIDKKTNNIEYVITSPSGKDTTFVNAEDAQNFIKDKNLKIEKETQKEKQPFYGEKVTDKELEYSANSLGEIREKYINGEIRAYEPVILNSRFKQLRHKDFAHATEEASISYNGKILKMRIFKKGQGKELIKYLKKAYGKEADRIISEWGVDENSYESLKNLSRDQFVRGVVHGQNKEHSKWVYLAGGPGDTGFPYVVLHTSIDGFLSGFVACEGNVGFERVSVDCEDIELHNKNIKNLKIANSGMD